MNTHNETQNPEPKHSLAAEQSVLGGLMLDNSKFAVVSQILSESDFFNKTNRDIFKCIVGLTLQNKAVDVITVSEEMEKAGYGYNLPVVGKLANDTPSAANIETWAGIVKEKSMLRQLQAVNAQISQQASNKSTDVYAVMANAKALIAEIEQKAPAGRLDNEADNDSIAFNFPEFPHDHYYGIAADVVATACMNSEAAPMSVYITFLTAAAALLGHKRYLQIGETKHYARIFSALVGASSRGRKGTSFYPVERIIRRAEFLFGAQYGQVYQINSLNIASGGLSSSEGLIERIKDTDVTNHSVIEDDKRLLVVEEELANVLKVIKRDGSTLSATLRRAWDGGDLAPITKHNQIKASNPHINVLSHITHFELKCLMGESDLHNGLSNRFLWACVRRLKKVPFPLPMDNDSVDEICMDLSKTIKWCDTNGIATLSRESRDFWSEWYQHVSQDEFGIIGSVTSRSEAQVMRLALLFSMLDRSDYIEPKHIQAGMNLVNFCNDSVKFIFTSPAQLTAGTDAGKLLAALEAAKGKLTQTEVSRVFGGHKSKSELMNLLNELQSMNKVKQIKGQEKDKRIVTWELIK